MKKVLLALLLVFGLVAEANAQFTIPYTFSPNTRAQSAQVNANFSILANALDRRGGTMTGDLVVQDVEPDGNNTRTLGSAVLRMANVYSVLGNFSSDLTVGGDVDVAGTITAGSGNVEIVGSDGRIPALSSTYFASLSGTNLTGVGLLGSANNWTARQDFSSNYSEEQATQTLAANGALNIDLANGTHHTVTLNANATSLNITNEGASGKATSFVLQLVYSSNTDHTVTWTGVTWAAGVAPTLTTTTGKSDFFTFISYDGGTTWYGFVGGLNF